MGGGIIAWTRGRSLVASCKLLVSSCQLLHGGPLCVALLILQPCLILLNGCEWIRLSTNFITNKHHVASLSVGRAFGPMGHGSWLGSLAWPESDSFRCRCKWRDPIRLRLFASVPTENTKKSLRNNLHLWPLWAGSCYCSCYGFGSLFFSAAYFAFGKRLGEKKNI